MPITPWTLVMGWTLMLASIARGAETLRPVEEGSLPADATAVVEAFHFNHAAADEFYVQKKVQVIGRVERIYREDVEADEGPETRYVATMVVNYVNDQYKLRFNFSPESRQTLALIKPHRQLLIEGVCSTEPGPDVKEIQFESCRFIKLLESPDPSASVPPGHSGPYGATPSGGWIPVAPTTPGALPSYRPTAAPSNPLLPASVPAPTIAPPDESTPPG